jgi:hypothetical protein
MSVSVAQPFNYAMNAAAFSTGTTKINSYATSISQNVPTSIICPGVNLATVSGTPIPVPASVFSAGSGFYHLWLNGPGTYDVCSTGNVAITPAGTIASSAGFFSASIQSVTAPGGAGACAIVQVTMTNAGAGPVILQNSGGAQTYSCQAIKIAN